MTSTRWCFTLNNYVEDELVSLRALLEKEARYAIFGKEVGKENQTPHLQGYISFRKNYRLKGIKSLLGERFHVEVAKGNEEQNFKYCSKENNYEEFGKRSQNGKRTDLDQFKEKVKSGVYDKKILYEEFSDICAKYPRFVNDYINHNKPRFKPEMYPLREWQAKLFQELKNEPHDRKVYFIVDKDGNAGKTWFCKYYMYLYDNSFYLRPTKNSDMAYSLPDNLRVLFMDCTRQQLEHFPYSFIESIKDGMIFSSKYESTLKTFGKVHVVVMMNEYPDTTKLSQDRYDIIEI